MHGAIEGTISLDALQLYGRTKFPGPLYGRGLAPSGNNSRAEAHMMLSVIGVFYLHRACIRDIHNKAREVDNSDRSIPLWSQLETNTPFFPPFFLSPFIY